MEVILKKNNDNLLIPYWNKKAVCSYHDPLKESLQWLQRNRDLILNENLIILGLGAGYHIIGLSFIRSLLISSSYPLKNVFILENIPAFKKNFLEKIINQKFQQNKKFFSNLNSNIFSEQIITLDNPKEILNYSLHKELHNELFYELLTNKEWTILIYQPIFNLNIPFYQKILAILTGREKNSLQKIITQKNFLSKQSQNYLIKDLEKKSQENLLSIKDIYSSISKNQKPSYNDYIWLSLKELIK